MKTRSKKRFPHGVWESMFQVLIIQAQGRAIKKGVHFEKVKIVYIELKWIAQGKGIILIGFPFCRSHVVVGRPGLG
jgi:hypothetical protein